MTGVFIVLLSNSSRINFQFLKTGKYEVVVRLLLILFLRDYMVGCSEHRCKTLVSKFLSQKKKKRLLFELRK